MPFLASENCKGSAKLAGLDMANIKEADKGIDAKKIWIVGTLAYTTAGLVLLFCWMLWGDFAWTVKGRTVGAITTLMVRGYGISDSWYAILIVSIPNFTNIFLIPWISYKSDRHRGRWGRRIPYLVVTTPIVVAAMAGLGLSSQIGEWLWSTGMFGSLTVNNVRLGVFAFFWLLLDLGTTLSTNIYGALSNDVVPREVIGRFQALARTVSLGVAVLFNKFLMDKAKSHATLLMLCIAAVYGIGLFSLCLMVKEGEYPPVDDDGGQFNPVTNLFFMAKNYYRQCFRNSCYRWLFAALALPVLAGLPYNTYLMFYSESLEVPLKSFGNMQATCFAVAFCMTFFLGVLSDKFHPLRTSMVSLTLVAAVNIYGGLFCRGQDVFLRMVLMHGITYMAYVTLAASTAPKLFPRSLFAQFNSALALITSVCTMLMAPVLGKIMDWSGHKYYLIFFIEAAFEIASIICLFMVYRGFIRHGGDAGYVAPDPEAGPEEAGR